MVDQFKYWEQKGSSESTTVKPVEITSYTRLTVRCCLLCAQITILGVVYSIIR